MQCISIDFKEIRFLEEDATTKKNERAVYYSY